MSGDKLTIVLFLIGTGLAFGQTALSQAGIKNRLLTSGLVLLAVLFVALGSAWPFTTGYFPAARTVVAQIATSPLAWFVVLIMGLTASFFFPRSHLPSSKTSAKQPQIDAQNISGAETAERKPSWLQSGDSITWNFDRNFLGMNGAKDGIVVSAFQGSAKNNLDKPIEKISGYVRRRDGKRYPLCVWVD
ncbi:MAG TPA: hypothetical protein VHX19_02625, partial [Stellaceae bacterium]|nr:hypothetical protein [Stellaceae bacterium]